MTTSASLCEGPILYLYVFTYYARVKVFSSIPFYFSLLQASCGGERSRHIYPVEYEWSWVNIVDITLEVNKLGGESISPYLSMCPAETFAPYIYIYIYVVSVSNHRRLNDGWVCGLAKNLRHETLPENMMNCNCKVDWEHSLLVFKKVYALYFAIVMNFYLLMRSSMIIYIADI